MLRERNAEFFIIQFRNTPYKTLINKMKVLSRFLGTSSDNLTYHSQKVNPFPKTQQGKRENKHYNRNEMFQLSNKIRPRCPRIYILCAAKLAEAALSVMLKENLPLVLYFNIKAVLATVRVHAYPNSQLKRNG